jgi:Holliday junction resolvase
MLYPDIQVWAFSRECRQKKRERALCAGHLIITSQLRRPPMAKRSPAAQSKHDHMVTSLVKMLIRNGYSEIRSAHLGAFEDPGRMPGRDGKFYTSDVIARSNGVEYVFEVETKETISLDYTKEQFKAFFDYAKKNNGVFSVIVPNDVEQKAGIILQELGMDEIKIMTM